MLATMLAYTYLAPADHDGKPYFALNCGAALTTLVGIAALFWVLAYCLWMFAQAENERRSNARQTRERPIHPAEGWVVMANAVAFGSGYVLGAANASYLLVLAVHHEVQYLYFAYAMARRPQSIHAPNNAEIDGATRGLEVRTSSQSKSAVRTELEHTASFLVWPVIGFAGAMAGAWLQLECLAPLGMGGLFCHYWLDGRIWTRGSFQN
jgi:hypothetical protein